MMQICATCMNVSAAACGLRRSRRPDAVVVDDDMGVEVRLQKGPSGAVAGSRLEPSRGPAGLQSFNQASKLPFKIKVSSVQH